MAGMLPATVDEQKQAQQKQMMLQALQAPETAPDKFAAARDYARGVPAAAAPAQQDPFAAGMPQQVSEADMGVQPGQTQQVQMSASVPTFDESGINALEGRIKSQAGQSQSEYSKLGGQLDQANTAEAQANQRMGELKAQYAVDTQGAINEAAQSTAEIQQKTQMAQQQSQQQTAVQMERYTSAVSDLQNADFHSYWADKGTGARAMGIVAAALGGLANGLAGQPGAPTALDRVIDRDMQMQMAQMQKKERVVGVQKGMLDELRERLGSDMAAMSALRIATNNKLIAETNAMANRLGGQTAPVVAQQIAAQLTKANAQAAAGLRAHLDASNTSMNSNLLGLEGLKARDQQVQMSLLTKAEQAKAKVKTIEEVTPFTVPPSDKELDRISTRADALKNAYGIVLAIQNSNNPVENHQRRKSLAVALAQFTTGGTTHRKDATDAAGASIGMGDHVDVMSSDARNMEVLRNAANEYRLDLAKYGSAPKPGSESDMIFKQLGTYAGH